VGDRFYGGHFGPERFYGALSATRGEDLYAVGVEAVYDGCEPFFVKDGNEGAADGAFHDGRDQREAAKLDDTGLLLQPLGM